MKYRLIEKTVTFASAYSAGAQAFDVASVGGDSFSCMAVIDVDTPGAKTFASTAVNTTNEQITITAHGYTLGLKGQVTNPGTLPTGISGSTDYFVIVIDADTIQLADSLAHAQAGTPINITAQGSGTNTFTPTAIAGGTIKLQQSNDNSNWADLGSATNVTADAVVALTADRPTMKWCRVYTTLTAGHISAVLQILVKGDRDV
jgi:hypothetical protein